MSRVLTMLQQQEGSSGQARNPENNILNRLIEKLADPATVMTGFFRRVKEGGAPSFPRFKPVSRFRCIELAQPKPSQAWSRLQ